MATISYDILYSRQRGLAQVILELGVHPRQGAPEQAVISSTYPGFQQAVLGLQGAFHGLVDIEQADLFSWFVKGKAPARPPCRSQQPGFGHALQYFGKMRFGRTQDGRYLASSKTFLAGGQQACGMQTQNRGLGEV
jgi:hypothetical protein